MGIETEYGITGGPDGDPVTASSILVNAFARNGVTRINWDFGDESPANDARHMPLLTSVAPMVETHLANTVLTNGARFYVDHAHPEYSSPECRTPLSGLLYDRVGEDVLLHAVRVANQTSEGMPPITVYKNNTDGKGNSYGTHENYLVDREIPFAEIVRAMAPHLISRQVILGAGKVGFETEYFEELAPRFQIAQRSEFFEELVGLETTLKRPIVNTRDEPHGDPERFRRLHVIIGDANMSEVATFVKLGSTALLLAVLEDRGSGVFPPMPKTPVRAVREYGADLTLTHGQEAVDGRTRSAWDYQDELWNLAEGYVNGGDGSAVASEAELTLLLTNWREMLDGVRDAPESVADRVDWVAKLRLVNGMRERHGLSDEDPRLAAIDIQYHDIRPEKSLARRVGLRKLLEASAIGEAFHNPPRDTRAYFRGRCIAQYPNEIAAANWDSIIFDLGVDPLHRVPMMDPLKGTAELLGELLDNASSAEELLRALGTL
ncbi:MAG: proteasome accessory factor PafA2 [Actinobacteria bacterium]|nr:proteasome accessory factor PafA2 [Actinomycetota bacterium]